MGNFTGAAEDLLRANDLADDAYGMLWRFLARGRSGQDGAPELSANAARLKAKDWPYPVIDFYLGGRSNAEMRGAAQKDTEKCEADFYTGEWNALKGGDAKTPLQAAVDKCPKDYIEYQGAVAELKRLK